MVEATGFTDAAGGAPVFDLDERRLLCDICNFRELGRGAYRPGKVLWREKSA